MKFTALKTNARLESGKVYELDERSKVTSDWLIAGTIEPFKKAKRIKKVVKPSETK